MTPLSVDMTYEEIKQQFDESNEYIFALKQKNKRSNKKLRKEGKKNDELIWYLLIQKFENKRYRTLYRKNLRKEEDDILQEKADEKIITAINKILI